MTCDEFRQILNDRCVEFTEKPTQNGTRFDCSTGETFNVFETGKMSFQRKQNTPLATDIKALYYGVASMVEEPWRLGLKGTVWARAQTETIRRGLLKIGAQVNVSVRRLRRLKPQGR